MAIIGSIRNRMGILIVIFVGFALLAFILGDFLTTNRSFIGGNDNSLAVISGEKIDPQTFDAKVKETEELMKLQQNAETLTAEQQDMARNQAWQQLLNDKIYGDQISKLGLTITDDEVNDMVFGKFLHPSISGEKSFVNPATGQFDPLRVTQYLKQLENPSNPEIAKARAQWVNFEEGIRRERLQSKYNDLIQKAIYVTNAEAKTDYEHRGTTYNIKYINLNYNTISDSAVTVDDDDLKNYYESHKWEFKQPETAASIHYVTFDVTPSATDRSETYKYLEQLIEPFKTTNSDSSFVNINSDTKFNDAYMPRGSFSPMLDSLAFSSPKGTVIGPFEEGNMVKIAKVIDVRTLPDSVRARHILLPKEQAPDSLLKSLADSLMNVLKSGGDWNVLAKQFSKDPGSAEKGGVYEWFPENRMVKPFNDFCFQNPPGEMGVVKTDYGYHVIQVLSHSPTSTAKVKLAIIDRKIEPGNETFERAYQKANQFSGKVSNAGSVEAFDKAAKEAGLTSRPAENIKTIDKQISGIGTNSREVVKWIYSAKPNEVSRAFRVEYKFVVAIVKDIFEAGYKTVEGAKDQITAAAKREKKAKMLIDKAVAAMNGAKTIDAIAAKLSTQAMPAQSVTFGSNYLPGLGQEPALLGAISNLKQGEISKPVKGQQGVFIVAVESVTKPAELKDLAAAKQSLQAATQNRSYEAFNALKEKAKVKDNRGRYY